MEILDQEHQESFSRGIIWAITALLAANQFFIGGFLPQKKGPSLWGRVQAMVGVQGAAAKQIMATKMNADGRTTTISAQPTITEVPAEPKGKDPVEAAKVVMLATGTPFYAPEGISFDDAEGALAAWQPYEDTITLSPELQTRWEAIGSTMTCDYCCGGPTQVTPINRCGCRHAKAYRSISKYLLQQYGDKYSNEEILGELQRWKGVWYPKGVVEDYLLATGRGSVLGHEPHGGSGADGNHGVTL